MDAFSELHEEGHHHFYCSRSRVLELRVLFGVRPLVVASGIIQTIQGKEHQILFPMIIYTEIEG